MPPQAVQARVVMTWPSSERWIDWISPLPPQVWQRRGLVPAAQPLPAQVAQTIGGVDGDLAAHPERGLGQGQLDPQQRVGALADPAARAARAPRAGEERLEDVAERTEAGERVAGRAGPPPPPPGASGSPPRSTMRRRSGSESTS